MIKYFYDTENKDYVAIKEYGSTNQNLIRGFVTAAYSYTSTVETIKIRPLSLRYKTQYMKRVGARKVPKDWRDKLSSLLNEVD